MQKNIKGEYLDFSFLVSAFFIWLMSALVMLVISTIILNEFGCSEKSLGYTSSLLSFLTALCAGIAAGRKRKSGGLYTSLLTSTAIVIALLTIGFIIAGPDIEASAVMSLVSFTFAGCMAGIVFFSSPIQRRKRYRPQP